MPDKNNEPTPPVDRTGRDESCAKDQYPSRHVYELLNILATQTRGRDIVCCHEDERAFFWHWQRSPVHSFACSSVQPRRTFYIRNTPRLLLLLLPHPPYFMAGSAGVLFAIQSSSFHGCKFNASKHRVYYWLLLY